jgi:hypothetical protein
MMEERRTKRHELVPIEDMGVTDGLIDAGPSRDSTSIFPVRRLLNRKPHSARDLLEDAEIQMRRLSMKLPAPRLPARRATGSGRGGRDIPSKQTGGCLRG